MDYSRIVDPFNARRADASSKILLRPYTGFLDDLFHFTTSDLICAANCWGVVPTGPDSSAESRLLKIGRAM